MTIYEGVQLFIAIVPTIVSIVSFAIVFLIGYAKLRETVAALVGAVTRNSVTNEEIKNEQKNMVAVVAALTKEVRDVQASQINQLATTYASMNRDVEIIKGDISLMKDDIRTIRENQQAAAFDKPQKGQLEKLHVDKKVPPHDGKPKPSSEKPEDQTKLEKRVGALEDSELDDLRIHKVDEGKDEDSDNK